MRLLNIIKATVFILWFSPSAKAFLAVRLALSASSFVVKKATAFLLAPSINFCVVPEALSMVQLNAVCTDMHPSDWTL